MKKSFNQSLVLRSLALVFSSTLVVACQGGGGGSSKPATDSDRDVVTSPAPTSPSEPQPAPAEDTTGGDTTTGDTGGTQEPTAPVSGQASATIRWQEPSQNTDGTALRDLIGYKISYGLSPNVYSNTKSVSLSDVECDTDGSSTRTCSYTVSDLSSASWYFAVQATDMDGHSSSYSEPVVVTVQ